MTTIKHISELPTNMKYFIKQNPLSTVFVEDTPFTVRREYVLYHENVKYEAYAEIISFAEFSHIVNGHKIQAIKEYRNRTKCGLKLAKDIIDAVGDSIREDVKYLRNC